MSSFDWGDLITAIIAALIGATSSFFFANQIRKEDVKTRQINQLYKIFIETKNNLTSDIEEYWSKGNEKSIDLQKLQKDERKLFESRIVATTQQLFKIGSSLERHFPKNSNVKEIRGKLTKIHANSTGGLFQSENRNSDIHKIKNCRVDLNGVYTDFVELL